MGFFSTLLEPAFVILRDRRSESQAAVQPPSMVTTYPVTKAASGELK